MKYYQCPQCNVNVSELQTKDVNGCLCHDVCGCPLNKAGEISEKADTGAIRSSVYPKGEKFPMRFDLMMLNDVGMRRLSETYGEGCAKYGPKNWMKGFPESAMIAHAMEHIRLHLSGDKTEDHLAHAAWNLLTLCWYQENRPEMMDLTNS